ncbi:hypothetical protein [Ammoniphilus sp. 3BR4]|uniref:hypothetical protein n=1 Tax=Ammoniphilus sp. 3BR4 TaxID=3158265 RepID=UPI003467DEFE
MAKYDYYIEFNGQWEEGVYTVTEVKDGRRETIDTVYNKNRTGLKEARQVAGKWLREKYNYGLDHVVTHRCVKPGRDESKNPFEHWTKAEYLKGTR